MTDFRNRYQACFYHLVSSVIVAGAILIIAKLFWYPGELMAVAGATKIFLLVILVDAGLGPLLTFVLFDVNKSQKALRVDFTFIIGLQICALIYGSYTLFGGRPVYYVFSVDRFELVQANDIPKGFLNDEIDGAYKKLPISRPQWVFAEMPEDAAGRNEILSNLLKYGADLAQTPKYYRPLEGDNIAVRDALRPISDLLYGNQRDSINKAMKELSLPTLSEPPLASGDNYRYLPMIGKEKDLTIIMSKDSLQVEGVVNLSPWIEGE